MTSHLLSVTFEAQDPRAVADFWAALLDREVVEDAHGLLLPGSETQVGLRFVAGTARSGRDLHLHLTSGSAREQQETVERALRLGASPLDVGQRPEEGHVVLADPGGNALCVIEPHNSYLKGTGVLGEVACDGSREVGLFWAAALGWPLVWEEGEETAVQSPAGGTKVAWGGGPELAKSGRNAQRLELVSDHPAAETERLLALGASRAADGELADPDGNEFVLRRP